MNLNAHCRIGAVLLERSVVAFCPNVSSLSAVVLALVPLLRPFAWQCLLLPVTPNSMLGFLEAPVPFIMGVQYKTAEVAAHCGGLVRLVYRVLWLTHSAYACFDMPFYIMGVAVQMQGGAPHCSGLVRRLSQLRVFFRALVL